MSTSRPLPDAKNLYILFNAIFQACQEFFPVSTRFFAGMSIFAVVNNLSAYF